MSREISCPACASPVEVDDRFALVAVCPGCDSTVVVDGEAARIHGKMGALAPPAGVLYLGATGALRGDRFRVVGRVRYGYARGYWNEWLLALEDGAAAWVSEDEDELQLERLLEDPGAALDPRAARPGDRVELAGSSFRVDEVDEAVCEGGEGMLPFPVVPGERTPYAELTGDAGFATAEATGEGIRVFLGARLDRAELVLDRSREEAGVGPDEITQGVAGAAARVVLGEGASLELDCDSCGAPLVVPDAGAATHACEYCDAELDLSLTRKRCAACEKTVPVRGAGTEAATCPHCHALLDVRAESTALLLALSGKRRPSVPIRPGMRGTLLGDAYEVIGHLRMVERTSEGTWSSHEFLMRRDDGATAWLVLEEGSYALKTELHPGPDLDPRGLEEEDEFSWEGRTWEVCDRSEGASETIDWVEGEFTWIPEVGDAGAYMEAECAPESLVAEWTARELEWYRTRYVSPAQVAEAFGLDVGGMSRPGRPRPGTPPDLVRPTLRPQAWVALVLSIACAFVGMRVQGRGAADDVKDVAVLDLSPPGIHAAMRAERDLALAAEAQRKALAQAEVDVKQQALLWKDYQEAAAKVRATTAALPVAVEKGSAPATKITTAHLAAYRKAAFEGIAAAADAVRRAYASAGAVAPTTFTTPGGGLAYDLAPPRQKIEELEAAARARAAALPEAGPGVPPGFPTVTVPFRVGPDERGCRLRVSTTLKGHWIHVEGEVRAKQGGAVIARFGRTLLTSVDGWRVREDFPFTVDEPGEYEVVARAASGRRGTRRVSLAAKDPPPVHFAVLKGFRDGSSAALGSAFYAFWILLEIVLWFFRLSWFSMRVMGRAMMGWFS